MVDQTYNAEMAMLGSLIYYQSERLDDVVMIVKSPSYFSRQNLGVVYKALLSLYAKNLPVEQVAVIEELQSLGHPIPGTIVTELYEAATATYASLMNYSKIVAEKFILRQLSQIGVKTTDAANQPDADPTQIVGDIERTLNTFSSTKESEVQFIRDLADGFIKELVDGKKDFDRSLYLETRIDDLNKKITGLFQGHMVVIGGMPSMGKSSLAIDIVVYNALFDRKALVFSIDETTTDVLERAFISDTGLDRFKIANRGPWEEHEKKLIESGGQALKEQNWAVIDHEDLTILDIRSIARRHKRRYGLDLIVIDYISQIRPHARFETRNLEITEVSRAIKAMAKELGVPVIVVSQLSRQHSRVECNPAKDLWPRPRNSWLRDSGSIEQDANLILFPFLKYEVLKERFGENHKYTLTEKEKNPEGIINAEIIVSKNKMGPKGIIQCKFDQRRMRFFSAAMHPE